MKRKPYIYLTQETKDRFEKTQAALAYHKQPGQKKYTQDETMKHILDKINEIHDLKLRIKELEKKQEEHG